MLTVGTEPLARAVVDGKRKGTVRVIAAIMWTTVKALTDVGNGGLGPVYIDLANIQAWQAIIAIIGLLGLSPAPWILGLAADRLGFTKPMRAEFARQLVSAEEAHEKAFTEQARHYESLLGFERARYADLEKSNKIHEERADKLTDAAFQMTEVVKANSHIIASVNQVAREVTDP